MAAALNVLTAMITPALLISASGTFILSTSNRIARVVDRLRALSDKIEEACLATERRPFLEEHLDLWQNQLRRQIRRLRLLQGALTLLYVAAAVFIFTSVAIGLLWGLGLELYWIPVVLGLSGACCLLAAGLLILVEVRIAVRNAEEETTLVLRVADHHRQSVG
jgi:hypothetical protein